MTTKRQLLHSSSNITTTQLHSTGQGEAGFDPVYGARPLKRAIQQQLENPLAQQILAGQYAPGEVIQVDVDADGLRFE